MRTKHLLTLVAVIFILAACVQTPGVARNEGNNSDASHPEILYLKKPECVGSASKLIIVTATTMDFSVQPPNLCVENGDTVTVKVTGQPEAGDVTIIGKQGASWIQGDNSADKNGFTFTVSPATAPKKGDTFFYNVFVQNFGTIDPMLTVDK